MLLLSVNFCAILCSRITQSHTIYQVSRDLLKAFYIQNMVDRNKTVRIKQHITVS